MDGSVYGTVDQYPEQQAPSGLRKLIGGFFANMSPNEHERDTKSLEAGRSEANNNLVMCFGSQVEINSRNARIEIHARIAMGHLFPHQADRSRYARKLHRKDQEEVLTVILAWGMAAQDVVSEWSLV